MDESRGETTTLPWWVPFVARGNVPVTTGVIGSANAGD
jgi:hypothetical protein